MVLYMNRYKVRPGCIEALVNEINGTGLEESFRSLPGRIKFDFSVAVKDEDTLYLNDLWADEESFENHRHSEASAVWREIKEKYVLETELQRYDI